jgi:hypothetical protein
MRALFEKWISPTGLLVAIFFLLPWQTRYIFDWSYLSGASTQFGILSLYMTQVLLILGLCIVYILRGRPRIDSGYQAALSWGAGVVFVSVLSGIFAHQSIPALAGMLDLTCAALAFLALLDKRVSLKPVMIAFVAGLCLPLGLGLAQVAFGGSGASTLLGLAGRDAQALGDAVIMLGGERVLRAYGSFPHPNIFGGYLAVALLVLSSLATLKNRKFMLVAILVFAAGLFLTGSRSALLGFMLGSGLTLLVLRSRNLSLTKKILLPIASLVVGAVLLVTVFAPQLAAAVRGGGALENRSLSERSEQYQEFLSTMQGTDWLFGNGPRNYVFALADAHPDRAVWEYQPIHNVPLLLMSELGVIGFLAVLGWVACLDRQNFSRFPERQAALAHGMGKVLFVIVFFDHYLWSSWAGLMLVAFVGASMLRQGEKRSDSSLL